MTLDVVDFAQALIRAPSVTPADAGAMDVLQQTLERLGFQCRRMPFGRIENLYARRGTRGPNLCFAGHTDVVPPGDEAAWSSGPFQAVIKDGILTGRGAVDMKGAIAAFVAAAAQVASKADPSGSLSLLITGDEEGDAIDGTGKVVQALMGEGEVIDHCILGEPTSATVLGDQIKVGRRGSLNAVVTVTGRQRRNGFDGLFEHPDKSIVIGFVIHANVTAEPGGGLTEEDYQLGKSFGCPNSLTVAGDGLFGPGYGIVLVTQNVGPEPSFNRFLVRGKYVVAQSEAGMQKGLIVLAGGIKVLDQACQRKPVQTCESGFDVRPERLRLQGTSSRFRFSAATGHPPHFMWFL